MRLDQLRQEYHRQVCGQILSTPSEIPNIADKGSKASVQFAKGLVKRLNYPLTSQVLSGQRAGNRFEVITAEFLKQVFELLPHLRPGKWRFSIHEEISKFEQYQHLASIQKVLTDYPELATALGGDYIVTPDILVARHPVPDAEINRLNPIVDEAHPVAQLTPLREVNRSSSSLILHASVSCKWTLRSDRAQNIRTEGLNLVRNRKGHIPHIVAVTAEPLPTRLASLALGTGDLDCAYYFALPELVEAVEETDKRGDQLELLQGMIEGRRLRDISDLPLDLMV